MPKKTREQKIKAALRKKTVQLHTHAPKVIHTSQIAHFPQAEPKKTTLSTYFISDFKKSLFLILAIITLELFFYFVSMNTNFRGIFKFIP